MEWRDIGIVIHHEPLGEKDAVAQLFTREYGLHSGLVKHFYSSRSSQKRAQLQIGNIVQAIWKSRLSEQLGWFTTELLFPTAAHIFTDSKRLTGLTSLCSLLKLWLSEREPMPSLFASCAEFLQTQLMKENWLSHYILLEIELLSAVGFGLDLTNCAATGSQEDLCYVSPKSGCAVSREAGTKYHSRLLPLPAFLLSKDPPMHLPSLEELLQGLTLTGYFLAKHHPEHPLPPPRQRLVELLHKSIRSNQ